MMDIGRAIQALKDGQHIRRVDWPEDSLVVYVPGTPEVRVTPGTPYSNVISPFVNIQPHLDHYDGRGNMQPGWTPTQQDLLAGDWEIV